MKTAVIVLIAALAGCDRDKPIDPHWDKDTCAMCRMVISDPAYAAQIVGPGASRRFYDDLGCALKDLAEHPELAAGKLYIRAGGKGAWVAADEARYRRGFHTPMGYGVSSAPDGTLTLEEARRLLFPPNRGALR
jgi:copper chaperone NosL